MDKGGGAQVRPGSKERRGHVWMSSWGWEAQDWLGGYLKGYPVSGLSKWMKSGGTSGWWSKNLHYMTRWGVGTEDHRDVTLPRSQGEWLSWPTAQLIFCLLLQTHFLPFSALLCHLAGCPLYYLDLSALWLLIGFGPREKQRSECGRKETAGCMFPSSLLKRGKAEVFFSEVGFLQISISQTISGEWSFKEITTHNWSTTEKKNY